jgi:hypothetical protein
VILSPRLNDPLTMPLEALQRALIFLGYLEAGNDHGEWDSASARALVRFKRHAARTYRMQAASGNADDVPAAARFQGPLDATLDEPTLMEVKQWIERGWKLPLGRFKLEQFRYGCLREDVLRDWQGLSQKVQAIGGTLAPPYGDTWRPLGRHKKEGASRLSFHFAGRAIDLNQRFSQGGRRQRYFLAQDPQRGRMFWRLFCRTVKQDGSQGKRLVAGAVQCFQPVWNKPYAIPGGYYLDLTEMIAQEGNFERIPARWDWEENYMSTEWWHWQYSRAKQRTFLDECELVGISEARLLAAGYSIEELDRRPG